MPRLTHVVVALVATMTAGSARADQTDWSLGIASIGIVSATPMIHVTVRNVSNSTSSDKRQLATVSPPPAYSLDGQVFCKAILGGSTRLVESQLLFGTPVVLVNEAGAGIWPIGVWDSSDPIEYDANISSADVSFDHLIDLPTTWNGGLELGFNPAKVVEDHLATWVQNGGSAADFLRQDDVFEVQIPVNLVGVCRNTSSYGVHEYAGYTRRWITASVFYQGDPDVVDPIRPAVGVAGSLLGPSLPPQFHVYSPASQQPAEDDGREPTFARFAIYDVETASYDGLWSGWVTYSGDICPVNPQPAVTPTGECVLVEACVPVEFDSCRALAGCCDAPLPLGDADPVR